MKVDLLLFKDLGDLLITSLQDKRKVKQICIGVASDEFVKRCKKIGLEIDGAKIFIDSFSLRHSFNKHGVKSISAKNGAIPLCPFDLMYLPNIIQTGKILEFKDDCILIEKDNIGIIGGVACEFRVSSKRGKRLYLKTMYNIKRKGS